MRKVILIALIILLVCSWRIPLSVKPIQLFNGKNLKGWHTDIPLMDSVPSANSPFLVRNGILVILGKPAGHLITNHVYQNYRLETEYRFPGKAGNSGILLHVSTPRIIYKMFPKSIEAQLQHGRAGDFNCMEEDITVPEMESRRGPKNQWGITPDKKYQIRHLADNENPVGDWNTMTIECLEDGIKIWVNNKLVNEGSQCTARKGQIALQSEGTAVEFRKIILTAIGQ